MQYPTSNMRFIIIFYFLLIEVVKKTAASSGPKKPTWSERQAAKKKAEAEGVKWICCVLSIVVTKFIFVFFCIVF